MDPVTLSLLISGGTALAKTGIGAAQAAKGRKLAKGARPQAEIPSTVEDYLSNAKAAAASSQLPGQSAIEQRIGGSSASGIRAATEGASSSAGLMAGIAGIKGNEQNALADLGIAGAQMQDTNKQRLQEALLKYGSYQDQQFQTNKMDPYYEKAQAAQALKGAGLQNIMGGVEQLGGLAQIGATEAATKGATTPGSSSTPFGMSSSTQKLGMGPQNAALGAQSNSQKFMNAKRKGFGGNYNSWLSQQSLGGGLNFSMV